MKLQKQIIPILTVITLAAVLYMFTNVVVYLIIGLVLSLLGSPIVGLLAKFKIGKLKLNNNVATLLTLGLFFSVIYVIGITFLPPLFSQLSFLSSTNFKDVAHNIFIQYPQFNYILSYVGTEDQIMKSITEQMSQFVSFKNVSSILNNLISYAGTILGGLFSVLFITFFFLKDASIVSNSILLVTPSDYETKVRDILRTSKKMLSKYFIGLFIDILLVSTIVTSLMWLFGIKNALVIGCLAGVMNVIPYIGPIITLFFAIFFGVSGCIEYNQYQLISSTITKIIAILIGTNLVDAILIQPTIFSNTVKAHPLEIFLVILMAGSIGGILGMVVAIPSYTLLRVIAKQFLVHFKFFAQLTKNISQ